MVDVTPLVKSGLNIIQGYDAQGFTISGTRHDSNIILAADSLHAIDKTALADFTAEDFACLQADDMFDMALIGWGFRVPSQLSSPVRTLLSRYAHSIDIMPTDAACRTYNVLLAEGRKFFAVLLR